MGAALRLAAGTADPERGVPVRLDDGPVIIVGLRESSKNGDNVNWGVGRTRRRGGGGERERKRKRARERERKREKERKRERETRERPSFQMERGSIRRVCEQMNDGWNMACE